MIDFDRHGDLWLPSRRLYRPRLCSFQGGEAMLMGGSGITVTQLGGAQNLASGTNFSTTADSPAGNCIIAILRTNLTGTASAVNDSAGNTYALADSSVGGGNGTHLYFYYCANALHLPSGGTINATTTQNYNAIVISVSRLTATPLDKTGNTAFGTATSTSVATGVLTQATEFILGAVNTGADPGAWTEAAGFTSNANSSIGQHSAYKIVNATSAVTYAPSWVNSVTFATDVISFKGS